MASQGSAGGKTSGSVNKGAEKITFEVDLKRPLGLILREIAGYGVYVDAVTAEGSANAAGVQVPFVFFQSGVEMRATLKSISHRCHLFDVVFVWELTEKPSIRPGVTSRAVLPPKRTSIILERPQTV